jgi:two-component system phosphate regulon sensor histidine kinase PhoR
MNSFRTRLTLIMIAMIALSVSAAGLFMVKTFKENHINALEDNMVREMQIISAKMEWKSGELSSLYNYYSDEANELKRYTGARVTFIRNDG